MMTDATTIAPLMPLGRTEANMPPQPRKFPPVSLKRASRSSSTSASSASTTTPSPLLSASEISSADPPPPLALGAAPSASRFLEEERNEWLASSLVHSAKVVGLLFDLCSEHLDARFPCPGEGFPAGFEYRWSSAPVRAQRATDARRHVRPRVRLTSGPDYVHNVLEWAEDVLGDREVFPVDPDAPFPSDFSAVASKVATRLFRAMCIMFEHARERLGLLNAEDYLLLSLRRLLFLAFDHELIAEREFCAAADMVAGERAAWAQANEDDALAAAQKQHLHSGDERAVSAPVDPLVARLLRQASALDPARASVLACSGAAAAAAATTTAAAPTTPTTTYSSVAAAAARVGKQMAAARARLAVAAGSARGSSSSNEGHKGKDGQNGKPSGGSGGGTGAPLFSLSLVGVARWIMTRSSGGSSSADPAK